MQDSASRATSDTHGYWLRQIEICAGERFQEIVESPRSVLTAMSDPDSRVRAAAVMAGYAPWNLSTQQEFMLRCYSIAENDPDEGPRLAAISVIELFLELSRDRVAQGILAHIVRDTSLSAHLRNEAYRVMLTVEFGWSIEQTIEHARDLRCSVKGVPIQLADVDWRFVDQFI